MDQMSWFAGGILWSIGILTVGLLLNNKLDTLQAPAEQGRSQRWIWVICGYMAIAAAVLLLVWFLCYE